MGEFGRVEQRAVRQHVVLRAVDANRHRRTRVVGLEEFGTVLGPGRLEGVDQPGGVFQARFVRGRRRGGSGLAAQDPVHQRPSPRLAEQAGCGDGLGNRGVVGNAQVPELVQADQQERVHVLVAVAQGLGEARVDRAPQREVVPARAEGEFPHEGRGSAPQELVQRAPLAAYPVDGTRGAGTESGAVGRPRVSGAHRIARR